MSWHEHTEFGACAISIFGPAEPVTNLIEELHRLPGIGPKSAQRLAYYLLRVPKEDAVALANAILAVKEKIGICRQCFNFAEGELCAICANETRDRSKICVVEEPLDVLALERTRLFRGTYHVLHGVLAPSAGVGPEELKIEALVQRIAKSPEVKEVIVATNPTVEGDATAMYVHRMLETANVKITRLARGLPSGGDLEYADEVTLMRALEGRREM